MLLWTLADKEINDTHYVRNWMGWPGKKFVGLGSSVKKKKKEIPWWIVLGNKSRIVVAVPLYHAIEQSTSCKILINIFPKEFEKLQKWATKILRY